MGFEHSVANMYLISIALLHGGGSVTLAGVAANLVPVTLGNMVGIRRYAFHGLSYTQALLTRG